MRALLDTHAFLWLVEGDSRLSPVARDVMSSPKNDLVLSAASVWEIVIKAGTGNLRLAIEPDQYIRKYLGVYSIQALDITHQHALAIRHLPSHHRDPFDRMIVAQATIENLPVITNDGLIRQYDVKVIW